MSNALALALRYAAHGLSIFPVRANKKPLVAHWRVDATTDSAAIEAWLQKWPHCDFAWALPADVVVVDLDMTHRKRGYDDFKRLAGCDARDVMTPQSTTPSGGLHIIYRAAKAYRNLVAINGTGIDTRSEGGYVVLPLPGSGNGREWLRPLIGAPLMPAPAWLDGALKREPLILAPRAALVVPASSSSDPDVRRQALTALERACDRIVAAPCGAQDSTRHAMCYFIGGLVARGDLDYATAYERLLEAARAMPVYREPWRNLDIRVARSIEAGIGRPLALSETEVWMREFRVLVRLKQTGARHG